MKKIILLILFYLFNVGDCVQIVKGIHQGSSWRVTGINEDGTYNLQNSKYVLKDVRSRYLMQIPDKVCKDNGI